MLSRETAISFVKETLHIQDVERKLENNKLTILNEIIEAHQRFIPFQSFSLIGADIQERKPPELQKCINECLCQSGGVCVILQGFFKIFLHSLDFNVYFVSADLPMSLIRNSHLVIICHDVEKVGDKYYVEVGLSHPTLCAIPLHTLDDGGSVTYKFCFLHIQLKKDGEVFRRYHKRNVDGLESDIWEEFLFFKDDVSREFSHFFNATNEVCTNESKSVSLQNCFATLYYSEKAITVKNLLIRIWKKETDNIELIECKSIKDATEKVLELFPMFPEEMIRKGYAAWSNWCNQNSNCKNIE